MWRQEFKPNAPQGCVTRPVRDHVQDRLGLTFEELGALSLKNIARPVEAFVVRLEAAGSKSVERSLIHGAGEALPLPDRPSIAVLAFDNMSGDPDQQYFSDGIAEDIITDLSRSRSLFVIARNSSFTYKGRAVDLMNPLICDSRITAAGGAVTLNHPVCCS
jgi:adenylate cyclase